MAAKAVHARSSLSRPTMRTSSVSSGFVSPLPNPRASASFFVASAAFFSALAANSG